MPIATDSHTRLDRRLNLELECRVEVAANSSWTTSSSLPHAIRLHVEAGVELVRVSADMVIRARPTRDLLQELNRLNSERAFTRRIVDQDGTVTIVAEMPLKSLRKGDLEQLVSMVHCLARLDAPLLADHGGLSVTDPSVAPALDLDRPVDNWQDLLQASGTATTKELQVWLDQWADGDCSIERDDESVTVWVDTNGRTTYYPFPLTVLRDDVKFLEQEEEEQEERNNGRRRIPCSVRDAVEWPASSSSTECPVAPCSKRLRRTSWHWAVASSSRTNPSTAAVSVATSGDQDRVTVAELWISARQRRRPSTLASKFASTRSAAA